MQLTAHLSRTSLLLIIILAGMPAAARSRGRDLATPDSGPRSAANCAALFGGDRAESAKRRQRIYWIDEEDSGITVAHSSEGTAPAEVELRGLRLTAPVHERRRYPYSTITTTEAG